MSVKTSASRCGERDFLDERLRPDEVRLRVVDREALSERTAPLLEEGVAR